jgi:hypothetical protein
MTRRTTTGVLLGAALLVSLVEGCSCESCTEPPPPFTRTITMEDAAALDDDATFFRTCQNLCAGDPTAPQPPDVGGDRDAGRMFPEQYFNCTREDLVLTCSELGVCAL